MGNGEVVGNQSVHWKIDHDKGEKKLKVNPNRPDRPTGDDEVNVDKAAMGRDPIPVATIGKGKNGYFNVRLRFDSIDQARTETEKALRALKDDGKGNFYLQVDIRALNRAHPDDAPPAEVRIDW